ncbi:hypothetical protein [Streptomyces sp. NPDC058401]|uniref:hypothetical protein n=1 Tax=Streptomyces sp. NPDC058401 TaxID=3346480 RepID=UPI003661F553
MTVGKDDAGPAEGRFGKAKVVAGKAKVVAKAGAGVLAATTIGVLAWKYKGIQEENDYLKSATGAAKTLKSYDR